MFTYFEQKKQNLAFLCISRCIVCLLSFSLIFSPAAVYAQAFLNLPIPGAMITTSPAFVPVLLKGMTIYPDDPLKFDFILDSGNTNFTQEQVKEESEKLVKYFLASMTVPKNDLWVNLSPYENDRIIPEPLGKTVLGRDLLAQDYILKQLTASLMYPEDELGKEFWDRITKRAQEQFGTTEIPVNTFNKVWILPESATVYEHGQTVYIVQSRLKVLLDEDYLALQNNLESTNLGTDQISNAQLKDSSSVSSQIVKEIILPEIEREVNEGKNFAPLRQIYNSLILAKWYKETIKESLLSKVYVDQNKVAGVELNDETIKDQIYDRYMEAYKKGVFNFIKEDHDALSNTVIPRKYFSGGFKDEDIDIGRTESERLVSRAKVGDEYLSTVRVSPQGKSSDSAMVDGVKQKLTALGLSAMLSLGAGAELQQTIAQTTEVQAAKEDVVQEHLTYIKEYLKLEFLKPLHGMDQIEYNNPQSFAYKRITERFERFNFFDVVIALENLAPEQAKQFILEAVQVKHTNTSKDDRDLAKFLENLRLNSFLRQSTVGKLLESEGKIHVKKSARIYVASKQPAPFAMRYLVKGRVAYPKILWEIGDIPRLQALLESEHEFYRKAAQKALNKIDREVRKFDNLNDIKEALQTNDPVRFNYAIIAIYLNSSIQETFIPYLVNLIFSNGVGDTNLDITYSALELLQLLGPAAISYLGNALQNKGFPVTSNIGQNVFYVLAKSKDSRTIPAITHYLKVGYKIEVDTFEEFSQWNDLRILPQLLRYVSETIAYNRDQERDLVKQAKILENSLKKFGYQRILDLIDDLLVEDTRAEASRQLIALGEPAAAFLAPKISSAHNFQLGENPVEDILIQIGSPVVPYIKPLLEEVKYETCTSCIARVLGEIGKDGEESKVIVSVLIDIAQQRNTDSLSAVEALGEIGPSAASALPVLVNILRDGDNLKFADRDSDSEETFGFISSSVVRVSLVKAIVQISTSPGSEDTIVYRYEQEAIDILVKGLNSLDRGTRSSSAEAIGEFGPKAKSAVSALIAKMRLTLRENVTKGINYSNSDAIGALIRIGPTAEAIPELISLLKGLDRELAGRALVKIGSESIPHLLEALNHDDWLVRYTAVRSLGHIGEGTKTVVLALTRMFGSENESYMVIEEVARSLGELSSHLDMTIPALLDVSANYPILYRSEVRKVAKVALEKIGEDANLYLEQALNDEDEKIQKKAIEILESIKRNMENYENSASDKAMVDEDKAKDLIKGKLDPAHHHLIKPEHIRQIAASKGNFTVVYDDGRASKTLEEIQVYTMAFNPLLALKDPEIRNVFRQIVERRYDVRVLNEVYGIAKASGKITLKGRKLTIKQFVKEMVQYLTTHANENPYDVADQFRKEFLPEGAPPELKKIFDAYMKIKPKVFDLEVIRELIPQEGNIVDVGAGHNTLGRQVLEYSDNNGLMVQHMVGTDINDWKEPFSMKDPRLLFFHQDSEADFPLSANSYDLVIIKWVLHHMTEENQIIFLDNLERILKPGGRLIIYDSLGATEDNQDIWEDYRREIRKEDTWPKGPWREANLKLNRDFRKLNVKQQKSLHALEDYFGHNAVIGREWMPQPFTYRTVEEFQNLLEKVGFDEDTSMRRVYGSAPIMRMGPPSIRLVFEKQQTPIVLTRGDGGHNKAMVLIDDISPLEKKHVSNLLDVLVHQDMRRIELEREKLDDIVLLGNERLDTIEEALQLLNSGIGQRIVILGGYGLATIPLIDAAVDTGYKLEISKGTFVDKKSWPGVRKVINPDNAHNILRRNEANLIRQIMLKIIEEWPDRYRNAKKKINSEGLEKVIIEEGSSVFTRKLLVNYRTMLDEEGAFDRVGGHRIVVIQKPHLQLRAKAAFDELFAVELRNGRISTVSHTVSYDNVRHKRVEAFRKLLREVWRIAIYSDHGKGYINLRNVYPKGINDIPQKFWISASYLFNRLKASERREFSQELMILLASEGLAIDEVIPSVNLGLKNFMGTVSDSAMVDEKESIDDSAAGETFRMKTGMDVKSEKINRSRSSEFGRREVLELMGLTILAACVGCDTSNSSRENVSGDDIPEGIFYPKSWSSEYRYVADVDKKIEDRGLSIEVLKPFLITSPVMGFGSPGPSYEYRFRITNDRNSPISIGKIESIIFGETAKKNQGYSITPMGTSQILEPGQSDTFSFSHRWSDGAAQQIAIRVQRDGEENSVFIYVALGRLGKRMFGLDKQGDKAMAEEQFEEVTSSDLIKILRKKGVPTKLAKISKTAVALALGAVIICTGAGCASVPKVDYDRFNISTQLTQSNEDELTRLIKIATNTTNDNEYLDALDQLVSYGSSAKGILPYLFRNNLVRKSILTEPITRYKWIGPDDPRYGDWSRSYPNLPRRKVIDWDKSVGPKLKPNADSIRARNQKIYDKQNEMVRALGPSEEYATEELVMFLGDYARYIIYDFPQETIPDQFYDVLRHQTHYRAGKDTGYHPEEYLPAKAMLLLMDRVGEYELIISLLKEAMREAMKNSTFAEYHYSQVIRFFEEPQRVAAEKYNFLVHGTEPAFFDDLNTDSDSETLLVTIRKMDRLGAEFNSAVIKKIDTYFSKNLKNQEYSVRKAIGKLLGSFGPEAAPLLRRFYNEDEGREIKPFGKKNYILVSLLKIAPIDEDYRNYVEQALSGGFYGGVYEEAIMLASERSEKVLPLVIQIKDSGRFRGLDRLIEQIPKKGFYFSVERNVTWYLESYDSGLHIDEDFGRQHEIVATLMYASSHGIEDVINFILRYKQLDVNARTWGEKTALMLALINEQAGVAKLLLSHPEIDVNAKDDSGRTALDYAKDKGHRDIVEMLIKAGAKEGKGSSPIREEEKNKLSISTVDQASLSILKEKDVGGIDMNEIEVERQGSGVNIQFDPAIIQPILESDFDGFAPVIMNFVPINSVLPLLGLAPNRREDFEISRNYLISSPDSSKCTKFLFESRAKSLLKSNYEITSSLNT